MSSLHILAGIFSAAGIITTVTGPGIEPLTVCSYSEIRGGVKNLFTECAWKWGTPFAIFFSHQKFASLGTQKTVFGPIVKAFWVYGLGGTPPPHLRTSNHASIEP